MGNIFTDNSDKSNCDGASVLRDTPGGFLVNIWHRSDKFDEFLNSLPCVVYQCTTELELTNISSNSCELIGIIPDRLLGNRSFWDECTFPDDRPNLFAHVERLTRGETQCCIHRLVNDKGLPIWVSHSFRQVETKSGAVIRGSINLMPIEDCLEKLDTEVISQFVHKIGNHFQLINLLLSSLRRNTVQVHDVGLLEHAVDRTVEFIRAFLSYSQIGICRSELDLGEILRVVMQTILPSFSAKRVSLNELIDQSCGRATLIGDPLLLETALSSLLQNAMEATENGDEVVVRFKIDHGLPRTSAVGEISIIDSGIGIAGDDLRNVMAPFYTTKRDRDGLGLSLAVRIIELHGGVLKLSSTVGQGTRVDIRLPLVKSGTTSER